MSEAAVGLDHDDVYHQEPQAKEEIILGSTKGGPLGLAKARLEIEHHGLKKDSWNHVVACTLKLWLKSSDPAVSLAQED